MPPINITAAATFDSPVTSPATGEPANQAEFLATNQQLTNRTQYVHDAIAGGDGSIVSNVLRVVSLTGAAGILAIAAAGGMLQIAAGATAPGFTQAQSTVAAGARMQFSSQAAASGSTTLGGDWSFVLGANDPGGEYPASPRYFNFGMSTAVGGGIAADGSYVNYTSAATLAWTDGGVVILCLGRGSNGVGAGVAGIEISAFAEISIATENHAPINMGIAGVGPTTYFLNIVSNDTTDEAAWSLSYFGNHPTSGEVAGIQLLYTETAMPAGNGHRWIDMQKGGVRQLSLRPWASNSGLTGGQLICEVGYLNIVGAVAILMSTGSVWQVRNSGVYGLTADCTSPGFFLDTGAANTSFAFKLVGTQAFAIEPFSNVAIGSGLGSYGGGKGVIFVANDNTDPTSSPVGGGLLYVKAGALRYRGSSGTDVQLAAA